MGQSRGHSWLVSLPLLRLGEPNVTGEFPLGEDGGVADDPHADATGPNQWIPALMERLGSSETSTTFKQEKETKNTCTVRRRRPKTSVRW